MTPLLLTTAMVLGSYVHDLQDLAASPRDPGTPGWTRAQTLCASRLAALGYGVVRHSFASDVNDNGLNIIGVLPGGARSDELVFLSAHYDSVPDCAGADDNASGVAGVLAIASRLAQHRWDRTLVIACWDQEENGLLGSAAYMEEMRAAGHTIAASVVLEMIGYADDTPGSQTVPWGLQLLFPRAGWYFQSRQMRGDSLVMVGDSGSGPLMSFLKQMAEANALPAVDLNIAKSRLDWPIYRDLRRSDHASFWRAGYPAIMVTDTAEYRNAGYHCGDAPDSIEVLDHAFAGKVIDTITDALTLQLNDTG